MKAYLTKEFRKDIKKSDVSEDDCKAAISKAEKGSIYADLGGGLIKQDIPRNNLSGARGARGIIFYKKGSVAVFCTCSPRARKRT